MFVQKAIGPQSKQSFSVSVFVEFRLMHLIVYSNRVLHSSVIFITEINQSTIFDVPPHVQIYKFVLYHKSHYSKKRIFD